MIQFLTMFAGGILKGVSKMLKYPIVRHIIASIAIITTIYFLTIKPLQKENQDIRRDYNELVLKQYETLSKLANKDTYNIENKVDVKKSKDGSNINLIPENTISTKVEKKTRDSVVNNPQKVGLRFWKKEFWKKKKK